MGRPEVRRGRQQHHIDAAVDHLLIGAKADEAFVPRHIDFRSQGRIVAELPQAGLELVAKGIAHGHQLDIWIGAERLRCRSRAAAATADEADA